MDTPRPRDHLRAELIRHQALRETIRHSDPALTDRLRDVIDIRIATLRDALTT